MFEDKPVEKRVLHSRLAGTWYTANQQELKKEIDVYLDKAGEKSMKDIHALILPHAGYMYSGQVAAYGIKQLTGEKYSRVVVLGPTHRYYLENQVSIPEVTHYATPLGEIALDLKCIAQLRKSADVTVKAEAHTNEHSVQIQLPLLQAVLGGFLLVPIVVGQLDYSAARRIADVLLSVIDTDTLVVVSSDFCHYGSSFNYLPFTTNIEENLRKLDMEAFNLIAHRDVNGFYDYLDRTGATICGRYAISVLLSMLGEKNNPVLLRYDTSGNVTQDFSSSVSYFCIAATGEWEAKQPAAGQNGKTDSLDSQTRQKLLQLARKTMESFVTNHQVPETGAIGVEITDKMKQIMGGFVTLKIEGELRGCIGDIFPRRPLYRVVMDHAVNSAVNDTRFFPVIPAELDKIEIEISALTPPVPVASYNDIIIGKHGIVLSKEGYSAVFLPQVATEQGWDLAETLSCLARKAGLPMDGWKDGADFMVFEAIVFGEHDGV